MQKSWVITAIDSKAKTDQEQHLVIDFIVTHQKMTNKTT